MTKKERDTKKDIVKMVAEESGLTQSIVKEIVQKTFDTILESLVQGKAVELRNFGVFHVRERAARTARNLATGEKLEVPQRMVVNFKPSKEMEKRVAQGEQDERFSESGFIPNRESELEKPPAADDNQET